MNEFEFVRFMEEKKQERIEFSKKFNKRDIYYEIIKEYNKFKQSNNKQGFIFYGLRGIGKSVALSQALKKIDAMFIDGTVLNYHNLDLIKVIKEYSIYNSSKVLFIDELSEIKDWAKALKLIYDNFNYKVIATGSSAIKLKTRNKEIIRRARLLELNPLSFREYLRIKKNIIVESSKDIFNSKLEDAYIKAKTYLLNTPNLVKEFREYLDYGFPLVFEMELESAIESIISKILVDDFSSFSGFNLEAITRAKKIIELIAISKPELISLSKFAEVANCSKTTASNILSALEFSSLLISLYPSRSSSAKLRKEKKYLFSSSVIRGAISKRLTGNSNLGAQREDFAISSFIYNGFSIEFIDKKSKHPDYLINKRLTIEIGGSSKTPEQIKKGIILKDSDEIDYKNGNLILPLYLVGLI